jgi:hypothetical protein
VRYNGRYRQEWTWSYEKWVFNIGFFAEPIPPTVFLDSEPSHTYSPMAHLR